MQPGVIKDERPEPRFEQLVLQFGHDCRHVGCNVLGCNLCRNNPKRRCTAHFREKYIDNVNRVFTAQCDAPIQLTLHDAVTYDEYMRTPETQYRFEGYQIQLCLLEGVSYDLKVNEVGLENVREEDLDGMLLLDNINTGTDPLLVPGKNAPGQHDVDNKLLIPLKEHGTHVLCRTSRSSQSAQGGRTRPFRMLAKAVDSEGHPATSIHYAVSDPFVVTTRRTQGAEKALIPTEDDPVNKLPGVGKETHMKLKDLRAAGFEYPLQNYNILKVRDLFNLMDRADDGLLSELGRVLGLTSLKIQELQQSTRGMAKKDCRRRVWGHPELSSLRLLYPCEHGAPLLKAPDIEVVIEDENQLAQIHNQSELDEMYSGQQFGELIHMWRCTAESHWWDEGHQGWAIWNESQELEEQAEPQPEYQPMGIASEPQRAQMDRQCKTRRVNQGYADLNEGRQDSAQYSSDQAFRANSGLSDSHSGPMVVKPFEFAVQAQDDYVRPPESVFSEGGTGTGRHGSDALDAASRDTFSDMQQQQDNLYNTNSSSLFNTTSANINLTGSTGLFQPTSEELYNSCPSSNILLDEPAGLAGYAYITAGNGAQAAGPIRFKRSVSGTRYKPTTGEGGAYQPNMPTINDSRSNELQAQYMLNEPPPLPSNFSQILGLPPRPSRELRSQQSFERMLDPIASWKQNRLTSYNSFEKYFPGGISSTPSWLNDISAALSAGYGKDGFNPPHQPPSI